MKWKFVRFPCHFHQSRCTWRAASRHRPARLGAVLVFPWLSLRTSWIRLQKLWTRHPAAIQPELLNTSRTPTPPSLPFHPSLPLPAINMATPMSPQELEDAFIKITFEEDTPVQYGVTASDPLYDPWIDQGGCSSPLALYVYPSSNVASNKFSEPAVFGLVLDIRSNRL